MLKLGGRDKTRNFYVGAKLFFFFFGVYSFNLLKKKLEVFFKKKLGGLVSQGYGWFHPYRVPRLELM